MKFYQPLHQGHSLSINLKSTFLLFSFSLLCFFASAKCVGSTTHFMKVKTQKYLVSDDLSYTLLNNKPTQDTASANDSKLIFLTGFSPDIDSELQTFTILGVENFPDNNLSIFDKWGQEVYSVEEYENDWDGTVDGAMVELGTYYYIFTDGKGKTYSGYVNIESNI